MLKFYIAVVFAIIGLIIIGYGIYKHPHEIINYLVGAISFIIAIVLGIPDTGPSDPGPTIVPTSSSTPISSSVVTSPLVSMPTFTQGPVPYPSNPKTTYGIAYKDEQANSQYYSTDRKIGVIYDTYYGRKDENGEYKDGYYSKSNSK